MKALLISLLLAQVHADEMYRIERFKKSGKISSKSIVKNEVLLKQSFDLDGKLRLEVYSNKNENSSKCFKENKSLTKSDNEFFKCLEEFGKVVSSQNGTLELPPRSTKSKEDITLSDKFMENK